MTCPFCNSIDNFSSPVKIITGEVLNTVVPEGEKGYPYNNSFELKTFPKGTLEICYCQECGFMKVLLP